jgi:hypothetical protein
MRRNVIVLGLSFLLVAGLFVLLRQSGATPQLSEFNAVIDTGEEKVAVSFKHPATFQPLQQQPSSVAFATEDGAQILSFGVGEPVDSDGQPLTAETILDRMISGIKDVGEDAPITVGFAEVGPKVTAASGEELHSIWYSIEAQEGQPVEKILTWSVFTIRNGKIFSMSGNSVLGPGSDEADKEILKGQFQAIFKTLHLSAVPE